MTEHPHSATYDSADGKRRIFYDSSGYRGWTLLYCKKAGDNIWYVKVMYTSKDIAINFLETGKVK